MAGKRLMMGLVLVALLLAAGAAQAAIAMDTVTVGNPRNDPDTRNATPGYGSVAYTYNIGKYEVTAGQYTAFLNAVAAQDTYALYHSSMWANMYGCKIKRAGSWGSYSYSVASDYANRPVNFVSFWDACRFSNWLQNGQQGAGTTEYGAYSLNGVRNPSNSSITRNADWKWAVTSEDEWYKAAYYMGGSTNAGYWTYATGNNTAPGRDMNDASGNNANYYPDSGPYPIDNDKYSTTLAGEFQNSASPYGTFDQNGNISEWNEAIISGSSSSRGIRGGSFNIIYDSGLQSAYRGYVDPTVEVFYFGFRVSEVPEPGTMALLTLGGLGLLARRRKQRA